MGDYKSNDLAKEAIEVLAHWKSYTGKPVKSSESHSN